MTVRTSSGWVVALSFCSRVAFAQRSLDQAWTVLNEGLSHESTEHRAAAAHALGLIPGSARARDAAENALTDEEEEVRASAATALGEIGAESSIPKLRAALRDEEAEVVFAATNALYKLKDPIAFEVFYSVLMGERKTGEGLLESQMDMITDPDALARIGFERGIGYLPWGGLSYRVFRRLLGDDDAAPIRAGAATKLAEDPDPKAGEALRESAGDDNWLVRSAVVSATADRDDPSLLDAVTPLMDDDNTVVRYSAAATTIRLSAGKE